MKILTCLILLLLTISALAEDKKPRISHDQLVFDVVLKKYDLIKQETTQIYRTQLSTVSGGSAEHLTKGMDGTPAAKTVVRGSVENVDAAKKLIAVEISFEMEKPSARIAEALIMHRGETRILPFWESNREIFELELSARFSCADCSGVWDQEMASGDFPGQFPFRLELSEANRVIADKGFIVRSGEKGNLQVRDGENNYLFDIEAVERGRVVSATLVIWKIREKNKVRTVFNDKHDMILLPGESRMFEIREGGAVIKGVLQLKPERKRFFGVVQPFRGLAVEEAADIVASGKSGTSEIRLLDLRSDSEFLEFHIGSAQHMDYYAPDFEEQLQKLDRQQIFLVYDRKDALAKDAMALLEKLGFAAGYYLTGGIEAWKAAGFNAAGVR
ncbi:MAG: rhodanese-like domain-containing protein [Candidatus Wallbacteria bacterium]|nr:rhodanese-like domain-containing protein [Candidatus Wallbacteria bacterium]